MKHNYYQTIRLPDGTVRQGAFDTEHWYDRMRSQVEVKDKTLLDVGCNIGAFCVWAKRDGATWVQGIDHDRDVIKEAMGMMDDWRGSNLMCVSVEDFDPPRDYDIILFSMIIHWIGKEQFLRLVEYAKDTVVVIFRSKNDYYSIPVNGKWFPKLEDLTQCMDGFELKHDEVLLEQDNNKKIILAVYGKSGV